MKIIICLFLMCLFVVPVFAVDDTACGLIAMGQIGLSGINQRIMKEHPDKKGVYWNIVGTAYHDFSKVPKSDVIIGLSGYRDVGVIYNGGRQMVEDAGAGFAYFHKAKDDWKLIQVELTDGKKYKGFEGADLISQGIDQLVIYSSAGATQIADVYVFNAEGKFTNVAALRGFGEGPLVTREHGQALMVDFQRAMVKTGDEFQIYYGRPYRWTGSEFLEDKDEFLNLIQAYDPLHPLNDHSLKDLIFCENYLTYHPKDFCVLADCYDLSRRLGLKDKVDKYRGQLLDMKDQPVDCHFCDDWLAGKNKAAQQLYLELLSSKRK